MSLAPSIASPTTLSLVRVVHRFLDDAGVCLARLDPRSGTHRQVTALGYPAPLPEFLTTEFIDKDEAYGLVALYPERLMSWRDIDGYKHSYSPTRWFRPYGFDEGVSMMLRGRDHAIGGVLHVSLRQDRFPQRGFDLLKAIRPELEAIITAETSGVVDILTNRENEVLALVAEGRTNQAIGSALGISLSTVRTHLENILRKTQSSSRTEAVNKTRCWVEP